MRHHRWTTAEILEAFERLPAEPFLTRLFFDISYQLTGDSWHSDSLRRALMNGGFIVRAGRKNRKLVLWQKVPRTGSQVHAPETHLVAGAPDEATQDIPGPLMEPEVPVGVGE